MLINLRNALMSGKRLPYDAEVEYLESTRGQYINTGITGGSNTKIEITASSTNTDANMALIGSRNRVQLNSYVIWQRASTIQMRFDYYGTSPSVVAAPSAWNTAVPNVIIKDGASNVVNGVNIGNNATSTFTCDFPFFLFGLNSGGGLGSAFAGKIYACKIYENGILVRDLIPVRKGTVGYLYDRVSGKLFGNAGAGDFVLGPDVVPVEYIESHGTEWIDTGVNGSQNLRTTFDYQLVYSGSIPSAKGLFGCFTSGAKYFLYCSGEATPRFQVGMGGAYTNTINVDELRHSIEYNNSEVSIDGNVVAIYSPYEYPTAHTLLLFALRGTSGSLYSMTPMRKWRVRMWDNGTLVRDYVPIRVGTDATSWEGAMMDVLTRRIYRNAGTGAFAYGNDLKYPIPAS